MGRDEVIERIVDAGGRAPSVHNTQPWLVRIEDRRHLVVRADPSRQLRLNDPRGREMFISCGAFIMNLRVAAAHEGLDAHAQLVPDPDDPLLAARITLNDLAAPGFFNAGLFAAIVARHTARGSITTRPLDRGDVELLRRAATLEHAGVVFLGPREAARGHLVSSMRRAEALAVREEGHLREDGAWLGGDRGRPEGVPTDAMGGWFQEPVIDLRPVARDEASGARTFESIGTTAVITTPGDDAGHWLVAGQALERMLLVATARGIHASFATRVLENSATRAEVEEAFHLTARAQMLVRFGYGSGGPSTPRRDIEDVLRRDEQHGTGAASAHRGASVERSSS